MTQTYFYICIKFQNIMKKIIYVFILLIQLNTLFSQQFVKFKVFINGIVTQESVDILRINYNKNTVDTLHYLNEYLYFDKNAMYELRFKKSEDCTINKLILNINHIESRPVILNINLMTRSKYSIREVNEGIFYYNDIVKDWSFYSSSEQIFE